MLRCMTRFFQPELPLIHSSKQGDAPKDTGGTTKPSADVTEARYRFGQRSLAELEGVHPTLIGVSSMAISISAIDFGIFDGLRTEEEQAEYVARGVSKTMKSMHLKQIISGYGQAVDAVPYINGKYRWENEPLFHVFDAFKRAATTLEVADKIRWGGCWKLLSDITDARIAVQEYIDTRRAQGRSPFVDMPHFELRL